MASPKLLLKTNHFIFPWFWSPLSMIFAKGDQDPPKESDQEQKRRGGKAGLKTSYNIHWKWSVQGTSYPQCGTQVCSGGRQRQGWRPALLRHLWVRDWWPQAGLKWGPGPWAVCGPREAGQDHCRLVVPSGSWGKKEKRTWWDRASDQWLQIRDTWKQNEWQKCL